MKILIYLVLAFAVGAAGLILFGPREAVSRQAGFSVLGIGEDIDAWLAEREAGVPNLRPDAQKQVVWAGAAGERTPLSIVYLHGFSASLGEIRPVPDKVAEALGANLFFARLSGHGRDGAAMAEPRAGDWIADTAEALEIGRRIGERVVVIATSTGGTLAAIAASDPDLARDLAGIVLVSPNFAINNPAAGLLSLPWARSWLPMVAGRERGFEPLNDSHAAQWTTRYPTEAAVTVKTLVDHASARDWNAVEVPALFLYSEHDEVVRPDATSEVVAAWGGPVRSELRVMGPGDDPGSHVIAGDILSPGQTEETVRLILDWASGL